MSTPPYARSLQLASKAAAHASRVKAASKRRASKDSARRDKLLRVTRSTAPGKRFTAHFANGRATHFGDPASRTYLDHGDRDRRLAYRTRHAKDLATHDPYRAGYLSYFLLWGVHSSMDAAVRAYNRALF
uniref:Uncharacterized protein n=1 Tax=viral metagenome TaxID=1070528 RepID=A0A6C0AUA4_9ZZZZ